MTSVLAKGLTACARAGAQALKNKVTAVTTRGLAIESPYDVAGGQTGTKKSPVKVWNEWDPLEEVIVGRPENTFCPELAFDMLSVMNDEVKAIFAAHKNQQYPPELLKKASAEVEEFVNILQHEGVTVRRPDIIDQSQETVTPHFRTKGLWGCFPRDILLAYGEEILEAPMAVRSRYWEYRAYRSIVKDYFKQGAGWVTAPKPFMSDETYDKDYPIDDMEARIKLARKGKYNLTEFEPTFDAASCMRAGKDLFVMPGNCTNNFGIEWLRRHYEPKGIKVHTLTFPDPTAFHMDECFIFVAPGIIITHPNPNKKPMDTSIFDDAGWDLVEAPLPVAPPTKYEHRMWEDTHYLWINILMLDPKRVLVEANQKPLHKLFNSLGIECVKVQFEHAHMLAGGTHCWTCDVRRRGDLQSYF